MTETSSAKPKITAIIITYNPDRGELGRLLDAIEPQVDDIVAVDNGSAGGLEAWFASRGSARTTFLPNERKHWHCGCAKCRYQMGARTWLRIYSFA